MQVIFSQGQDAMAQVLITMRRQFARRFAKDRSLLDVASLFAPFESVELLGQPGYSMRVWVKDTEIADLERALRDDFIVESDYVLQLLTSPSPATERSPVKGVAGRAGR